MKKTSIENLERALKWEKKEVEKRMNKIIYEKAEMLTNELIDIGIKDRNPQAINAVLDRGFGKARQNIGLDGGAEDKPIVFMPAALMSKYQIGEQAKKMIQDPEDGAYKEEVK